MKGAEFKSLHLKDYRANLPKDKLKQKTNILLEAEALDELW